MTISKPQTMEITAQDWLDLADACDVARANTPYVVGFRSPVYWRTLKMKLLLMSGVDTGTVPPSS